MVRGPGEYAVALRLNQRGGSYEGAIPGGRGRKNVGGSVTGGLGRTIPGSVWRRAGALVAPVEQEQGRHPPVLKELAGAGFVAVGFDAWQHGERATESRDQILERVFGGFRRRMWPMLGQTTLDALRVIDWALAELGAGPR